MVSWLADLVLLLSAVGLLWALVMVAVRRPLGTAAVADRGVLGVAGLLELALVVQLVVGVVLLAGTDRPVSGVTFVGYLVGSLLIVPVGLAWALADRSRWGPGVLAVAFVTIPVMILRMVQIWNVSA